MNELCDFHVEAAILGDVRKAAFLEPVKCLQTIGDFFHAKGGVRDGVQLEAMIECVLDLDEHIKRRNLAQIKRGVAMQYLIVEPDVVKTHDKVGAL